MIVGDIMKRNLRTIGPETTLSEAGDLMKQLQIRHLPIVEKATNKIVGLVSDRDIKKIVSPFAGSKMATERDNATLQVRVDVIVRNEPLSVVKATDTVKCVAEMMLQKKISAVPVVDEGKKLTGIVTSDDLIRTLITFL